MLFCFLVLLGSYGSLSFQLAFVIQKLSSPGLFKVEWEGDGAIALNSKTYYCFKESGKPKVAAKGVSQRTNKLTKELYLNVLRTKAPQTVVNRRFVVKDGAVRTYEMRKNGLSYFYGKRKVLADGVSTASLDI